MQKTILTNTDCIKVTRINYPDGSSMDKVKLKISDNTCITGCYVDRFVDVQGYKKKKCMAKRNV